MQDGGIVKVRIMQDIKQLDKSTFSDDKRWEGVNRLVAHSLNVHKML